MHSGGMISLLLLAQLTAASPAGPLFTYEDLPIDRLEEGQRVAVLFRMTVGPDGRVLDCRAEASNSEERVNAQMCATARRGRFQPASKDGQPTYGVYRTVASWWLSGDRLEFPASSTTDLDVSLNRLPAGVQSPARIEFSMAVGPDGRISTCQAGSKDAHPVLVKIGCEQLAKSLTPLPAKTAAGTPVESVQTAAVLFKKS